MVTTICSLHILKTRYDRYKIVIFYEQNIKPFSMTSVQLSLVVLPRPQPQMY